MSLLLRNFQKNIRWSGNARMFQIPYQPYTGSKKDKVKNSFLNRIVTSLRMLVFQFYFVNHISSHVIEASGKSSYSFLELFLWIINLCHVRYLKLKPRRHWSQKYSFLDILIIRPEVGINLPIKRSKWSFSSS